MPNFELPSPQQEQELRKREQEEYRLRDKKEEDKRSSQKIVTKMEKAKVGDEVDMSRQNLSGLTVADLLEKELKSHKKDRTFKVLKFIEDMVSSQMAERGMIRPAELSAEQKQQVAKIQDTYESYLLKYNCSEPDFSTEQIMQVNYMDQFGIGGLDTFYSNNIYMTRENLQPQKFPRIFAHEYGHFISIRSLEKLKNNLRPFKMGTERRVKTHLWNLSGKLKASRMGHILVNEGVTELFCQRVLAEAGMEFQEDYVYQAYRDVVSAVTEKIGVGDKDHGLDYFIESMLTGNDEELIARINEVYADSGGYDKFIDLLNHVQGIAGNLNQLEHNISRNVNLMGMMAQVKLLPIEGDRHYKKLLSWVRQEEKRK